MVASLVPGKTSRKARGMSFKQANAIVHNLFENDGWDEQDIPEVVKTKTGWTLSDGHAWETARRSPDELRNQCKAWMASFRSDMAR